MRSFLMDTVVFGRSFESRDTLEILSATSWPSTTSPKMVCRLSSQGVAATVMKNWLPLVPGPELAIESFPAFECFPVRFQRQRKFLQAGSCDLLGYRIIVHEPKRRAPHSYGRKNCPERSDKVERTAVDSSWYFYQPFCLRSSVICAV